MKIRFGDDLFSLILSLKARVTLIMKLEIRFNKTMIITKQKERRMVY